MSSFRRSFTSRRLTSRNSVQDTSFDNWLRFNIQSAMRQAEPSPATWDRIREQLESGQPGRRRSRPRFMIQKWPRHVSQIMQVLFKEPDLAERLTEQKLEMLTKMLTLPGSGIMRWAVT